VELLPSRGLFGALELDGALSLLSNVFRFQISFTTFTRGAGGCTASRKLVTTHLFPRLLTFLRADPAVVADGDAVISQTKFAD